MNAIAIIPARGGSKRIPRKNIRDFCGKPIIAYSIETALQSGCFEEVMVSTDDEEIAEIARKYGALIPFMRSKKTANDHAGLGDVIIEVLKKYNECQKQFHAACCILPTAPLIQSSDIINAYKIFEEKKFDTVFPIVRFSYPILRALKEESGKVSMIWPEYYSYRSQDLTPAFHDSGQFYWLRPEVFIYKNKLFSDNSGCIEIPESRVQDIDTEEDWKICELKFQQV
jgi:pseudaminic acid cytidylyltransferase